MSTIFTGVKGNDNLDLRILLLFMDRNEDVEGLGKLNQIKFGKLESI